MTAAAVEPLREALAELVACKDLKESIEPAMRVTAAGGWRIHTEESSRRRDEYNRRQPLAWQAARAALRIAQNEAWKTRDFRAWDRARAALSQLPQGPVASPPEPAPDRLFEFIAHGDERHRSWLRKACEAFYAGQPKPEPEPVASPPMEALTDEQIVELFTRYSDLRRTHERHGATLLEFRLFPLIKAVRAALASTQPPTPSGTARYSDCWNLLDALRDDGEGDRWDVLELAERFDALASGTAGAEAVGALRAFAQAVLADWPEGAPDGFDLQDLALHHGMIQEMDPRPTAPCMEEGCWCAEYFSDEDWAEGVTCYRRTPLLLGTTTEDTNLSPGAAEQDKTT